MTTELITFLILGAAAGGFINGLTGSGTALFALGFYLVVLEPITAVAIVAVMSVLVGLQGLWIVRSAILSHPGRLLRFAVPGLIGVPLGGMLLDVIDASTLRLVIGSMLVLYGAYFGLRSTLPAIARETPLVDVAVGLTGGVLGGATAVSGAIPSMWLALRPWTKSETRAVLQPFNAMILSTTITLLLLKGAYDQTALTALIVTIPAGFIAAQAGIAVFRAINDMAFRRLLILLTLLMGIGVLASEVF